jgi:hypothetical protein
MARFTLHITKVATGGPYAYVINQNGLGIKAAAGIASISAAIDAVKSDIAGLVPVGESVTRVGMDVTTA